MKTRAGLKLCGRKPTQTPTRAAAMSPTWWPGQALIDGEDVGEDEEGGGGDRDDPGCEAIQAVHEVDRVDREDDQSEVSTVPSTGPSTNVFGMPSTFSPPRKPIGR